MQKEDVFYKALLERDRSFEGTFIVGVKTTGIFCRPSCPARKPKRENVEFFTSTNKAIAKGYRPCKVCRPMEKEGKAPEFIVRLLNLLEKNPSVKIKDFDLRGMGLEPNQVRRWFLTNHGITFHAYQRMYRINNAFKKIQEGLGVTDIAFESGYESLSGFNSMYKNIIGVSPLKSKNKQIINLTRIETNMGTMIACATNKGICLLEFSDRKMLETELKHLTTSLQATIIQGDNVLFKPLEEQLNLYFQGKLQNFDLPLHMVGTAFQKQVWETLLQIPYGITTTYAKQADLLNKPTAIRAVANANGMNKIAIIIPCHRVVGSDGSLTGYGGGLWRKKKLLELEHLSK
jgi:AraC family transcriptional regulator of adaptative response/methylated-DNA-[protein]-cysteine methyltransferase